jgi:hypothetical protein
MAKFQMGLQMDPYDIKDTARLGGNAGATPFTKNEANKLLKLAGDSRYDLCAVGNKIEAICVVAGDLVATSDGYVLGSVQKGGRFVGTAEGSEAAGTGSIAVGDFVVAGTPDALGTALTTAGAKVRKATNQPGSVPADLTAAGDQIKNATFGWRVVAILTGTGAVGDKLLVERVNVK